MKVLGLVHIQRKRLQKRNGKYRFIAFLLYYSYCDIASCGNCNCKNGFDTHNCDCDCDITIAFAIAIVVCEQALKDCSHTVIAIATLLFL